MNKLTNNVFSDHVPNDLYLPMFGLRNEKGASEERLFDAINTACAVALTSTANCDAILSTLSHSSNIFKSIVSTHQPDLSSRSFYKAFAPVVRYRRFLQDILPNNSLKSSKICTKNWQSLFQIFHNLNSDAKKRILKSNLAEHVPLFFFTAQLRHRISPHFATIRLNQYQQKPPAIEYDKGIENMVRTIDPENASEKLSYITDGSVDLLAHNLLDIRENRLENITTTGLYKAYKVFIDQIYQLDEFTNIFSKAPQWLKNDPNFMRRAIGHDATYLLQGSKEIQQSRDLVLQALRQHPSLITQLLPEYLYDYEYAFTAMQGNGRLLRHMSGPFRQDFNMVIEAVKNSCEAVAYATGELRNNEEIILEAIRHHGVMGLCWASDELKNNKEFLLKAGRMNPKCLFYFSSPTGDTCDFVFNERSNCSFREKPTSLYKALECRRATGEDEWLEATFIDRTIHSLVLAELEHDKDFMLKAGRVNPKILLFISETLKQDGDFMLEAGHICPDVLQQVSGDLIYDKNFMLQAGQICPRSLSKASTELRKDRDFMLQAGHMYPAILETASEELLHNKDFMLIAGRLEPDILYQIPKELTNDKDFMLKAGYLCPVSVNKASKELKQDRDFMLQAGHIYPKILLQVSGNLINDKDFMLQAGRMYPECLKKASKELKNNKEFIHEARLINPAFQ